MVADHVRLRAWLLLQAATHDLLSKARDAPVVASRPVMVLRRPDLAHRIGLEPSSAELVAAERFLERRGYIRPVSAGAEPRAFVITDLGRKWLASDRWTPPWWRRVFGG